MPNSLNSRVDWIPMATFDSATLTGSYQAFGNPLPQSVFLIKVVNESDVGVNISNNGTDDKDRVSAGGFFLYDESANANNPEGGLLPKNTQIYVKGTAGTGNIYLVGQYRTGS